MPKFNAFPAESDIPVLSEVSDRVDYIADLMESLVWKRGKSAKILAKVWNLSKSSVEHNSVEASRLVTADRDTAARDISVICSDMIKKAHRDGKAKDAAMIGKLWADVSGANAPVKQELTVDVDSVNKERARKLMGAIFSGGVSKDETAIENATEPATEPLIDNERDS